MFIIIEEDGTLNKSEKVTVEEYGAVNDGYLTIINTITMEEWFDGKWVPLKVWGE